jgi:hypothetical protein
MAKALRTPEARGRLAHFAWFERTGFLHTRRLRPAGRERRREETSYKLSGGGRKLLHELDGCPVEARAVRGRSLPETPFGVRLAESGGLTTCRALHTREDAGPLRRHGGCEDAGLVWQLYAPPATR